jgi:NAD-dependent SIR2 family protein deacetylase
MKKDELYFFCGAGVSYPAGLFRFRGLVNEIYKQVGTYPTPIEQEAINREQFDATLDILEHRLLGQRFAVRSALKKVLQPNLRLKGATDTHSALLQLSCTRGGTLRLVTTNFDHVFERAAKRDKQKINSYAAPMIPIPKNSKWNGIVYLHGLLPINDNEPSELNRLVLTSGDFGLAYLTERWASRFVSELFRNYVVLENNTYIFTLHRGINLDPIKVFIG